MMLFRFTGRGLALGAEICVVANSLEPAKRLALEWAESNAVEPGTIILKEVTIVEFPQVVYGWNGDY